MVLTVTFMLLACVRYLYPNRFKEFVLLPITDKYFTLQGKGYENKHPFNLFLFIITTFSFSLFFFILSKQFGEMENENPWLFTQIVTGFSVFILARHVLELLVGQVFNMEKLISRYLHEKQSYTSLLSLVVLWINIIYFFIWPFSKLGLVICMSIIAVLYVTSLLSSFKRNWKVISKHPFYFILYLCALEIAPFVILYKLLL
jgi:hypothetical protein